MSSGFSFVMALLTGVQFGSGQTAQPSEALFSDASAASPLTEKELGIIMAAQSLQRGKSAKMLELRVDALRDGEVSIPLPENKSAAFRIERAGEAEVWKGRQNGKIRMSLRKVGNSYTGYMYANGKRYSIVGIGETKVALVETDMHGECGVGRNK